ncbi:MAG: hypothetical protein V3W41_08670 [Planctomycetota bacterium]
MRVTIASVPQMRPEPGQEITIPRSKVVVLSRGNLRLVLGAWANIGPAVKARKTAAKSLVVAGGKVGFHMGSE